MPSPYQLIQRLETQSQNGLAESFVPHYGVTRTLKPERPCNHEWRLMVDGWSVCSWCPELKRPR